MTWYELSEFGTTVLEVLQDDFELYESEDQLIAYSDGLHAPIATKRIKRFVRGRTVGGHQVSGHYKSSSRQSGHWVNGYRRGGHWQQEHWVDTISDTYVPHENFCGGVGPKPPKFVDKAQFVEIIGRVVLGTCD